MNLYKVESMYEGNSYEMTIKYTPYNIDNISKIYQDALRIDLLTKGFITVTSQENDIIVIDMDFIISDNNGSLDLSYTHAAKVQQMLRVILRENNLNKILE